MARALLSAHGAALMALLLAALAAGLTAGLTRGEAYGRYIAAQALVEGRRPVLDGHLDGLRGPGDALPGVAYVGGHYYLAEAPLATWLAAPLYALSLPLAALQPGAGWGPAVVGLYGPLLLLLTLLGVAALARQCGVTPIAQGLIVLCIALMTRLLDLAVNQAAALVPTALLVWLLVGVRWRSRAGAVGHGLLGGLLMGVSPWLAPAALLGLVAPRRDLAPRGLGLLLALAPVALWQWLLLGRPWRLLSQFPVESGGAAGVPAVAGIDVLLGVLMVLVVAFFPAWRPQLLICLLAFAGGLLGSVPLVDVGWSTLIIAALVPGGHMGALHGRLPAWMPDWVFFAAALAVAVWSDSRRVLSSQQLPDDAGLLVTYTPQQTATLVALVLVIGSLLLVARFRPRVMAAVVGLLLTAACLAAGPRAAAAEGRLPNLLAPVSAPAAGGGLVRPWQTFGAAESGDAGLVLPDPADRAESPLVAARPGERYCARATPAPGATVFAWEDDGHRVLAEHGGSGPGPHCFAAPPGATGLRLRLVGPAANPVAPSLWADSVRTSPLPDYAVAALAFTFDWESAMGGPIHSKGGSAAYEGEGGGPARDDGAAALEVARQRGARMRRGAEMLADLFATHGIRGTFYATGYNLLPGNPDRRTFAGDPTYRWPRRQNSWASDYWLTHPWYADDPYGTEASHPEWYYASLVRRLAEAGHEIETHTFGHLYVRGTTPDELAVDLAEWNAAARALGLPPARSFAFPWQSSNSVRRPHYERLTQAGITSITRVYPLVYRVRPTLQFELDEVEDMPGLLVYPDRVVKSTPEGSLDARRAIDEVLLRHGYLSLWTHPEEVVDPAQVAVWREVIDYTAAARAHGLWVAPLGEIVEQVRAVRRLEVIGLRDGGATLLRVTNRGAGTLRGGTLELAGPARVTVAGQDWSDQRDRRLRLPDLLPGQALSLVAWP